MAIGILSYCANGEGCYDLRDRVYIGPALYNESKALEDIKDLKKVFICLHKHSDIIDNYCFRPG